jgi:hypothetical protein
MTCGRSSHQHRSPVSASQVNAVPHSGQVLRFPVISSPSQLPDITGLMDVHVASRGHYIPADRLKPYLALTVAGRTWRGDCPCPPVSLTSRHRNAPPHRLVLPPTGLTSNKPRPTKSLTPTVGTGHSLQAGPITHPARLKVLTIAGLMNMHVASSGYYITANVLANAHGWPTASRCAYPGPTLAAELCFAG